jgi:hypothetical protein
VTARQQRKYYLFLFIPAENSACPEWRLLMHRIGIHAPADGEVKP